ncbi:glutamate receptor 2.7-like [Cryptomeria japonica]|uniref:glutamate receptor 2.7-like n=1 Tax=Cryptomeria japonica TaxID=3369 RepID=UPI0027D9DD38|nr:glutamate receptor 2.7-like [Cryptomeria japonica]
MVGTTYQSGGFGFVFRKGFPLVQEFSKGILNLSESDKFEKIKAIYFSDTTNKCPDSSEDLRRLGVESFWGLYLITGTISSMALIIFLSQDNYSRQKIRECKSINCFLKYIYQERVSSQFFSLQMLQENNNSSNAEDSSSKHHELDVSVMNDADQNMVTQTPSFVNPEIIDGLPSNQIHEGEKSEMSCTSDRVITK